MPEGENMICEKIALRERFAALNDCSDAPTLSIYLPDNLSELGEDAENKRRPCLLICPGGGYSLCSEREAEPIALHFLPAGFNVFILRYSVAPYRFPAQLCEVAAAMELIWQNAAAWHCDPMHVAIMGFSAGGHLAAHYSTAYDCAEVRARFPESRPVQASVLCYPVITADPAWTHGGSFETLTGSPLCTEQALAKFSCDRLVTGKTPPAFLWHTTEDACVPVMNSLLYAQALSVNGVSFALHVYPYGQHGLATCDTQTCEPLPAQVQPTQAWLAEARQWLELQFGL